MAVENACAGHYLRPMLAALPIAVVVALGTKAKTRLRRMGRPADIEAQHPSARANTNPAQSWIAAAERFREIASAPLVNRRFDAASNTRRQTQHSRRPHRVAIKMREKVAGTQLPTRLVEITEKRAPWGYPMRAALQK